MTTSLVTHLGRALEEAIATGTNRDVELAYAAYLKALEESKDPGVRALIPEVRAEIKRWAA